MLRLDLFFFFLLLLVRVCWADKLLWSSPASGGWKAS